MLLRAALGSLLVCSSCISATARPVEDWSEHKLTDCADFIVIATPTSSQDEPADRTYAKRDSWVGVNTKFQVSAVLKGKLKGNELTLLHNRYFGGGQLAVEIIDGPTLVKFDVKAKTKFLLFLKRLDDGRFEPVSGQYDPSFSVKVIQDYTDPPAAPPQKP